MRTHAWALAATLPLVVSLAGCDGGGGSQPPASVQIGEGTSNQCIVTFSIGKGRITSDVEILADYSGVDGSFGTNRHGARCRSLVPNATMATALDICADEACEQPQPRQLQLLTVMGLDGDDLAIDGPADLFDCKFEGDGASIANITAETVTLDALEDRQVSIRVRCDGWPDSTTTTSTSTTTDTACSGGCGAGDVVPIQFWLDDPVRLSALQFEADFRSDGGQFAQLPTGEVRCRLSPDLNAMFATAQIEISSRPWLTAACPGCDTRFSGGLIFGDGHVDGPTRLMTCDFVVGNHVPSPEDFTVTVVDDSYHDVTVEPRPAVSVRGLP